MLRLSLSLLLVSLVLAIDQSTDSRFNRRKVMKLDSTLTKNFPQRRQQLPHVEIAEDNAGRYFRRRPQTTTVSSIFSMKVESESQHVYPNMRPLENLHVEPKQEKINMTEFPPTMNWNNPRPNNVHRRIPYTTRRRPSYAQTSAPIIQQAEEITEQVVNSTKPALIVFDDTVKEQEKVVLATSDSYVSNEVPSLDTRHQTISEKSEAFTQRIEETPEKVIISTSKTPVVVSTTEKVPEKTEITRSTAYVSNPKYFVKRRRPSYAQKLKPIIQQAEEITKQVVTSTTTVPFVVDATVKAQDEVLLATSDSNVSNEVPSLEERHQTISQIPEAFILMMEETPEKVDISTSNLPVIVATTETVPKKPEFAPSAAYVSTPKFFVKRRHPSYAQTSTPVIQQTEEITKQVVTSTTTAPFVVDVTVKTQEKVVLATSDSNVSNEVPSLGIRHQTISQIPEAFIQRIEETPAQVFISTSNVPVIVSTTEKVPEKREFISSMAYLSTPKFFVKRRRPSYARTSTPIIRQAHEITEQVVTSTTTSPIIVDTTIKEQEEAVLATSNSNVSNEVPSLEIRHLKISKMPKALIQRIDETPEQVFISTSKAPVVFSTTEKIPEFTPSAAYISNLMSFVQRRRPILAHKTTSPLNQEKEAVKQEQAIDLSITAPVAVSIATEAQDKKVLSPPASYFSDLLNIVRQKTRRPLNRGSHKFNRNDITKDQSNVQAGNLDSNSAQLTSTTTKRPPPVPTLSPWYDGFGK